MRILHINTQSKGGAANAAIRLHHGLLQSGHESFFLTLSSDTNLIPNHIAFPQFSKYGLSISNRIKNKLGLRNLAGIKGQKDYAKINVPIECFSSPITDYNLAEYINDMLEVDIINLHWAANFLDYWEFFSKINKPVVWTLHDENPFSSYWHYSLDNVQSIPALKIHAMYLRIKDNALKRLKTSIHIVAPSNWLKDKSFKSQAFRLLSHYHIPYGLDTDLYKITNQKPASLNDLKESKSELIGLFICQSINNKRKGMAILKEALIQASSTLNCTFIAIGKIDNITRSKMPDNIKFVGEISDEEELVRLYNYADFTIIPSLQDNLPNTMLESLCCGTPVLATPAGGIPEVIKRHNYGIVAKNFEPQSLVEIIQEFSKRKDNFDLKTISQQAHKEFGINVQANAYIKLYESILS